MTIRATIFFGCLALLARHSAAQQAVKKDLGHDWQVFTNNHYESFSDNRKLKTIYFLVNADKFSRDKLCIHATEPFSLFINGKLAAEQNGKFSIDSLAKKYSSSRLLIAIHQDKIIPSALQTTIETPTPANTPPFLSADRPATFFRDFVVVALIILLLLLIVVMRLNPKLASDYFSIMKIFSLREGDDSQVRTRISTSTNVLFYGFCSLIVGFYLLIIFHFLTPLYVAADYFKTTSFLSAIAQWIELSLLVLGIFVLKMILIYAVSNMFGARDVAGIHFFNWIRMLLIVFGILSVIVFTYFILRGHSIDINTMLLKLVAWCLVLWTVLIFLKLNGRSDYSLFHLFSYICATEIIPLVIIITVLYK